MNPRFAKELRPLLLPWAVAALGAAGHLVARAHPLFAHGDFGAFLIGLAGVAFVLGVLVLSALPAGSELHHRTLALLLSQPTERLRIWRDKLVVATLAVLGLAIVHGLATAFTFRPSVSEVLLWVAFAATAVCSVGFYTLAMRSLLVGIVVAVGTPFAIAWTFFLIVYYVFGIHTELSEHATVVLIVSGCAVYSLVLLWLGRRQFAALELKDGSISRAAQIPDALVPRKLTELFQARPTGAVANLIRKEICLQKPIFLVSAIFVVGWLLTWLLMPLRPAWHEELVGTLYGLTGAQMVLVVILTGCVSLGDDKALGTTAWHLTLPVSAHRQWFTKLFVAAATLFAMAFVLPTILSALTLFKVQVGLLILQSHDALILPLLMAGVFVVSFWSASLTANTVRAAMTCLVALISLATCVFSGVSMSEPFLLFLHPPFEGLQSGLIARVLAHFQLPPDFLANHSGPVLYSVLLVFAVVLGTALIQSRAQFRRTQIQAGLRLKYSVVLLLLTFAGSFWCADLAKSIFSAAWRFDSEIQLAVASLPKARFESGTTWTITPQELDQAGGLSNTTKTWLRNARIEVSPMQPRNQSRSPSAFIITVSFRNGRSHSLSSR